ncbi:hypothetical protein PBAL39_02027 [Pedobacter sp. BAL39]|uniref:GNAT family N-acetyltransferase n=1 Tax=Pedobacter sp. BAL39 TaxID=391596 RepID=UPI0001559C94|nr:GNAT family N-acetyltransferase [Pedobacter sp. BAL39]EDM38354.1 hypothetical protein PBAL39_02027 [Pedobacter sp. BAL39]
MIIRKANIGDAEAITTYLLLAMGDIIYQFIGRKNDEQAKAFMLHFVKGRNNQYAYENCWVAEDDHRVVAAACCYEGGMLRQLRRPVLDYIKNEYQHTLSLEDETQEGEVYLDCLCVDPSQQGKGIGSKMLQFLINEYLLKQNHPLGLLVDPDRLAARRLYLRMGFRVMGHKDFAGKKMEHLQINQN